MIAAGLLSGLLQCPGTASGQPYSEEFRNPPAEARVRVWWHWMDGNITREGIKADLDWMHAAGIAGVAEDNALYTSKRPLTEGVVRDSTQVGIGEQLQHLRGFRPLHCELGVFVRRIL